MEDLQTQNLPVQSPYREYVVGVDTKIPISNGQFVTAINFDNAATTPPFVSSLQAVVNFAPWYSSIHRGTGYKSKYSSELYENSREIVADFVNADTDYYTVVYVKNTTEAINKLSFRLGCSNERCVVISSSMEHHSNDLPWRSKYYTDYIGIDSNGRLSLKDLEKKLSKYRGTVRLVTVTGASNVTGNTNPVHEIAAIAHSYKAKILVDGAQLIPHVGFDMKSPESEEHIDYLAFSAHKMYAPFGAGVLIAPKADLKKGAPDYKGGGTIDVVTRELVKWAEPPHKDEAGTPNLMGVMALVEAIRTLNGIGMKNIEKYELMLTEYCLNRLKTIPGIRLYGNAENCKKRLGIIPFNIKNIPHGVVAAALSDEAGIAVRSGCFCAQPYVQKLLNVSKEEMSRVIRKPGYPRPGMVRLSFGLYNSIQEIDELIRTLHIISENSEWYIKNY